MLYSEEVKKIIKSYDWPAGQNLRVEIGEEPDDLGDPVLIVRLFRNNFSAFEGVDQLKIAKIIGDLIPRLNTMGIPTRLDVAKGDGLA